MGALTFAAAGSFERYRNSKMVNTHQMIVQSKISVLYPLKEKELPVHAVTEDGRITSIKVRVEGTPLSFSRNEDGHFKNCSDSHLEPSYIAYIERQLTRIFR